MRCAAVRLVARSGLTNWINQLRLKTAMAGSITEPPSGGQTRSLMFSGSDHTATYQRYRPTYPHLLYEAILDYLDAGDLLTERRGLAVDLACGSGQATIPLTKVFSKVIAVDISPDQIAEAQANTNVDNVEYRVASAEKLDFLSDSSVDLVTCAQGFHWLEPDVVYAEVKRVLTPGGVLAIFGHGLPVLDYKEANDLMHEFTFVTVEDAYNPKRQILMNHYRDVKLPFPDAIRNDDMKIEQNLRLSEYMGYLSSWSGYRMHLEKEPDSQALPRLAERLKAALYTTGEDPVIHVTNQLFLLMGKQALE